MELLHKKVLVTNHFPFLLISANFPDEVVEHLPEAFESGIYYGWAKVDNGGIHKMVMSVGWNPYYKNTKRSMVSLSYSVLKKTKCF